MSYFSIAVFVATVAVTVGGALDAISNDSATDQPKVLVDKDGGVMNPMIAGQVMLPSRALMENISASPERTVLAAALMSNGEFTLFAPTNTQWRICPRALEQGRVQLAQMMGYLVVPRRYDSQTLLRMIGEGGGQARLRPIEGGVLVVRLNGPTNVWC